MPYLSCKKIENDVYNFPTWQYCKYKDIFDSRIIINSTAKFYISISYQKDLLSIDTRIFTPSYFKMCGISILYTCQEINDKFLFRIQKSFDHTPDFFSSLLCLCGKRNHQCPFFYLQSLFDGFDLFLHLASLDLI